MFMAFTIISTVFSTNSLKESIMFLLSLLHLFLDWLFFIADKLCVSFVFVFGFFFAQDKKGEPTGSFFLNYFTCQDMSIVFFFFINLFILFIYFWLHWVFVAACRLSLVAVSRGYSLLQSHCGGLSCCRARALGTRASVVVARGLE